MVEVAGAGTCFRKTPPRKTLYAWTPVPPSVEAFQLRAIWLHATAHALSELGVEGAFLSAGVVPLATFE
ncbi:MAG: hypothetical protein E6J71_26555 [Deltaproteobacteria bacterium]|nr:MAG: hypothetical protein E6J71_26555 [Deltaproteobacteria bacterium]